MLLQSRFPRCALCNSQRDSQPLLLWNLPDVRSEIFSEDKWTGNWASSNICFFFSPVKQENICLAALQYLTILTQCTSLSFPFGWTNQFFPCTLKLCFSVRKEAHTLFLSSIQRSLVVCPATSVWFKKFLSNQRLRKLSWNWGKRKRKFLGREMFISEHFRLFCWRCSWKIDLSFILSSGVLPSDVRWFFLFCFFFFEGGGATSYCCFRVLDLWPHPTIDLLQKQFWE